MADRTTRLYAAPLRIDVTVRHGIPRVVPLARVCGAIRAAALAAGTPIPASVGLVLTDDEELAGLNRAHMGRRGPTDVLSFPLLPPESFGGGGPGGRRRGGRGAEASSAHDGNRSIGQGPSRAEGRQATVPSTGPFRLPPGVRVSLGDIAVSVERAIAQARKGRGGRDPRTSWDARDELLLLVIHGTLHLCGWGHAEPEGAAAMRALERRLLAEGRATSRRPA